MLRVDTYFHLIRFSDSVVGGSSSADEQNGGNKNQSLRNRFIRFLAAGVGDIITLLSAHIVGECNVVFIVFNKNFPNHPITTFSNVFTLSLLYGACTLT